MKEVSLLLAIGFLVSCASTMPATKPSTEVLEGRLVSNFEQNEFIACSGAVYWVASTGPAYVRSGEAQDKNRTLRITAVVSPEGEYGHMGMYSQEISIKTAEIGTRTPDCGVP